MCTQIKYKIFTYKCIQKTERRIMIKMMSVKISV